MRLLLLATLACAAPTGTVADATDCDDQNAAVNPSVTDDCDSVDSNCDGVIDDAMPPGTPTAMATATATRPTQAPPARFRFSA